MVSEIPPRNILKEMPTSSSVRTRVALALVIAAAYLLIAHTWSMSRDYQIQGQQKFHEQENRLAVRQRGVTGTSAMGYLLLGAAGAVCLVSRPLRNSRFTHPLNLICLAYFAWCSSSILWSQSVSIGFRKTSILALVLLGAFGMARKVNLTDLPWIVVIISTIYIFYGLVAEMYHGTFQPWKSDYRFAGTVHPNDQGLYAAILCLSAVCLSWQRRGYAWLRYGLLGVGLMSLIMSKSRTSLASLILAFLVILLLRARGQQRLLLSSSLVSLACLVGIGYGFVTVSTLDITEEFATMGRQSNVESLSGRVPLWNELLEAVEQRPFAGYGFGSFWNEKNIRKYSEKFAWNIPHAHNAYIDLVLATGGVGLALYLLWIGSSFYVAAGRYRKGGWLGDLFVLGMIALSLVHGFAESKFPSGGLGSFILFLGMITLATRPPFEKLDRDRKSQPSGPGPKSPKRLMRRKGKEADRP